jgi:hypothetical protein
VIIDSEVFMVAYLSPLGNVSVELPNDPPLPFYQLWRITGSDDGVTDCGTVQVNIFGDSRNSARIAAREMHARMLALSPKITVETDKGPACIDHRRTILAPAYLDYQDENLWRYVARYELASRLTSQSL